MKITPELNATYSVALKNLVQIGKYCGLTEEQSLHDASGAWVIDYIKQIQTAANLYKGRAMASSDSQGMHIHSSKSPLPSLPAQPAETDNGS